MIRGWGTRTLPRMNWRRGLRVTLWAAAWTVVRAGVPTVMRPVQAQGWAIGWRGLVDRIVRPWVQVLAWVWCLGLWWLFGLSPLPLAGLWLWPFGLGPSWLTVLGQGPAVVAIGFGLGRLLYPVTPRGRARSRFNPDGFADWDRLRRNVSGHAVRLRAVVGRPSLRAEVTPRAVGRPSAVRLARVPARRCGTGVGKTAIGTSFGVRCYVPHEGTLGYVAIPREWKTSQLENNLLDHDGPGMGTQTKPETFLRTAPVRALRGPVRLIDPEGTTGHRSTLHWNPAAGCTDPQIAMENAAGLSSGAKGKQDDSGDNNAWFRDRAAVVLRALLLIADIAGKDMSDVYRWSAGTVDAITEPTKLMTRHRTQVPAGWLESLVGVMQTKAERTRDGIMLTLAGSVEFMGDPKTAELTLPADGEPAFDVAAFLRSYGFVYMIATDRPYAPAAPFLSAFTSHVVEASNRLLAPGARLDPPLGLFLDEAMNTIPMPLDKWLADSGGRGRKVVWSAQSRSQAEQRYGRAGADTVWNATTAKVIGGGVSVPADLADYSRLTSERTVWEAGKPRHEPVMTPSQVADIPRWHGLLVTREVATLVRFSPSWRRRDVLAARFAPRRQVPAPAIERARAGEAISA